MNTIKSQLNNITMKQLWILCLGLCLSLTAVAQEEKTIETDDTRIKITKDSIVIKTKEDRVLQDEDGIVEEPEENEWKSDDHDHDDHKDDGKKKKKKNKFRMGLMDIGISTYLVNGTLNHGEEFIADGFALNHAKSNNINLHIFRHRVHLLGETLYFEYGLSTNWRRYSLANDIVIEKEPMVLPDGNKSMAWKASEIDNRKNKLRTSHLEIPVMITISPKDSKFSISAGAYGGMRIGSSQKFKSKDDGKRVIRDDYEFRDFQTGLVGRIGFGPIDFYCQYSLDPLFNNNVIPELMPISFGISVLGF